jgi:hypothetical protein
VGIERSFLTLSLAGLAKTDTIFSSDLKLTSDFSAHNGCGDTSMDVYLYWTGTISSSTDWSNQPGKDRNLVLVSSAGATLWQSGTSH